MNDDKVTAFRSVKAKTEEAPLRVIDSDYNACQHIRFDIHPALPRIFCRDCDTDLDPFWVLRRIAGDHRMRTHEIDRLKEASAKMEKLVKRQLEGRRSPHRAEGDARHIQRLQETQRADPSRFKGDIAENGTLPEDRRGVNPINDKPIE